MHRLFSVVSVCSVLSVAAVSTVQAASDFPTRPIRMVVGFGAGGATDTFTRIFAGPLQTALGQTVFVENVAGASGYIGWRTVASATPDGYTLLMSENAIVMRPGFKDVKPTFDPAAELEPVAFIATSPLAVCVSNTVAANTMKELVDLSHSPTAKKLTNASAGVTSVSQLSWEVIRDATKLDVLDVPYRGGGPAMADLIAGHVDINVASSQVAKPLTETKQIKCLAVTSAKRSAALPSVPTLAEQDIKTADVDLRFWFAIFGPKNLPAEVKTKIQQSVQKALTDPTLAERLKGLDITPEYGDSTVLAARLAKDIKNWGAFIEEKGLKGQ